MIFREPAGEPKGHPRFSYSTLSMDLTGGRGRFPSPIVRVNYRHPVAEGLCLGSIGAHDEPVEAAPVDEGRAPPSQTPKLIWGNGTLLVGIDLSEVSEGVGASGKLQENRRGS